MEIKTIKRYGKEFELVYQHGNKGSTIDMCHMYFLHNITSKVHNIMTVSIVYYKESNKVNVDYDVICVPSHVMEYVMNWEVKKIEHLRSEPTVPATP